MGLKEAGLRGSLRNVSVGASAIPDSVVDNFESKDSDPVGPYETGGSLSDIGYSLSAAGAFERTSTRPFEGSFSMECNTGGDSETVRATTPSTDLPKFPERGTTFGFEVYLDNSDSGVIIDFFSDDTFDNGLRYWIARDGWFFQIIQNGTQTTVYDSVDSTPKGEWLSVEIASDSSTVTAQTFDQADNLLDEYQESTSINGGNAFGFDSSPSQGTFAVFVDNIRTL